MNNLLIDVVCVVTYFKNSIAESEFVACRFIGDVKGYTNIVFSAGSKSCIRQYDKK